MPSRSAKFVEEDKSCHKIAKETEMSRKNPSILNKNSLKISFNFLKLKERGFVNCAICKSTFFQFGVTTCIDHGSMQVVRKIKKSKYDYLFETDSDTDSL